MLFPSSPLSDVVSVDPIADYVRILAARSRSYYRVGSDSEVWFVFKDSAIFGNPCARSELGLEGHSLADFVGSVTSCVTLILAQRDSAAVDFEPMGAPEGAICLAQKAKGATDFSVAPRLVPSPRYLPKSNYCNCGQAALAQVALTVSGAAFQDGL